LGLEWPEMSEAESLERSRNYFDYQASGPRYVCHIGAGGGGRLKRHDKAKDFFREDQRLRNQALWTRIRALPPAQRWTYFQKNGLNQVGLDGQTRDHQGLIRFIKYRKEAVFTDLLARPKA